MSGSAPAGEVIEGTAPGGRRRGLVLGVGVLVAALAAGAVVGVPIWQRHQDRVHQQQAYDTGHAALLAADCATAEPALARAAGADAVPGLAAKAAADRTLCTRHLAATASTGTVADRLTTLLGYLGTTPAPPPYLLAAGRDRATRLLLDSDLKDLTDPRACSVTDDLAAAGIRTTGDVGRRLPAVLLGCVKRAEQDGDPSIALDWLERLQKDFPAAPETRGTQELSTRLWVQTGRLFHSEGTLPAWDGDPSARERSDRARLEIYNDSRDPITLRLSGPTVTEVTFPACTDCTAFPDDASGTCQRRGTFRTVLLEPGTYELVTGQQRTRLKYGRMPFRGHEVYRRCFYSLR